MQIDKYIAHSVSIGGFGYRNEARLISQVPTPWFGESQLPSYQWCFCGIARGIVDIVNIQSLADGTATYAYR